MDEYGGPKQGGQGGVRRCQGARSEFVVRLMRSLRTWSLCSPQERGVAWRGVAARARGRRGSHPQTRPHGLRID